MLPDGVISRSVAAEPAGVVGAAVEAVTGDVPVLVGPVVGTVVRTPAGPWKTLNRRPFRSHDPTTLVGGRLGSQCTPVQYQPSPKSTTNMVPPRSPGHCSLRRH